MENLVADGLRSGRLRFVLGAANAVPDAEFVYLCVPTPQGVDGVGRPHLPRGGRRRDPRRSSKRAPSS